MRAHLRPRAVRSALTGADVERLTVAHPFDGFQSVETWRIDHRRFDGTRSGPLSRVVCVVAQAATVLPYDPVRDRVLLVEQLRFGAVAIGDPRP